MNFGTDWLKTRDYNYNVTMTSQKLSPFRACDTCEIMVANYASYLKRWDCCNQKTAVLCVWLWYILQRLQQKLRAAVGTTVTQRTVRNWLLQGQLLTRHPVACIPLTPRHCRLRRQRCQARANWRTELRSVVFSDESRFCLGDSDVRVLVRRRPGERLKPNCLWPRYIEPTPRFMVCGAISYDSRSTPWLFQTH
ncbi:transposable element Tcb2 transposase [Trichonephila clavipes]|nr:transposable element Tcb2 transposase [Trichonephila clavipes]